MPSTKHTIGTLIVGALISTSASYASELPKTQKVIDSGTLTISNALGYPPLQYADDHGKPSGMNIELADAVARYASEVGRLAEK